MFLRTASKIAADVQSQITVNIQTIINYSLFSMPSIFGYFV